jgi:aspartate/methionine/tyrosine aminotransferase
MFSDRTDWKLTRNRFTKAWEQVRAAGREVVDLTISNPTRAGFDYDEAAILAALQSPRAMDYDPQPKGLLEAREAVSGYYGEQHATTELDPEQLILTTSTSEGYSYVFRLLCNPGDEVLIPKPSYPLFEFLADLEDVKLVPYPLLYDHGWQIDFPSMPKAVSPRTRAIVVVHPNNPTGSYVKPNEQDTLNGFCAEHDLALIVDEVFLDYPHDGKPRSSFALNRKVLTFTLSGLSKVSALPQMKVAWMVASGPKAQGNDALARLEVIADTYLSMNAPTQWAVPILLEQRKSMRKQLLDRVLANLAELDRQLDARRACQRLGVEGGWYAILRVPVTGSDEDLTIALLRSKSVLVHPGHFYDFPGEGHLVLSLIGPKGEFAEGIRRVLEMVDGGMRV